MSILLQTLREAQGCFDIPGLAALVAAGQENDQFTPTQCVIHPVTGPIVDAHLRNTGAQGLDITRNAVRQTVNPGQNTRSRLNVGQAVYPFRESVGLADLDHECIVSLRLHFVNTGTDGGRRQTEALGGRQEHAQLDIEHMPPGRGRSRCDAAIFRPRRQALRTAFPDDTMRMENCTILFFPVRGEAADGLTLSRG